MACICYSRFESTFLFDLVTTKCIKVNFVDLFINFNVTYEAIFCDKNYQIYENLN